jgi:hypothetical protein
MNSQGGAERFRYGQQNGCRCEQRLPARINMRNMIGAANTK